MLDASSKGEPKDRFSTISGASLWLNSIIDVEIRLHGRNGYFLCSQEAATVISSETVACSMPMSYTLGLPNLRSYN